MVLVLVRPAVAPTDSRSIRQQATSLHCLFLQLKTQAFLRDGLIKAVCSKHLLISFVLDVLLTDQCRDGGTRVFPHQIDWETNNTVVDCINQCQAFGFPAAGLEFGTQCFCGDVSDAQNNSPGLAPEADCSFPCSGDAIHLCGGPLRLSVSINSQRVLRSTDSYGYSTMHSMETLTPGTHLQTPDVMK